MSAYTHVSANTAAIADLPTTRTNYSLLLWALVLLILAAYSAPWIVSSSAALSFGAYDLAEWASLPPGVRSATPPLVASFLLRLVLTLTSLWLAFAAPYRRISVGWFVAAMGVLALTAAQLPPLEFFTVARTDPNYGQQATLALISLVGGFVGLLLPRSPWLVLLAALVAALGGIVAASGALSAHTLLDAYAVNARISAGPWITAALFAVAALWCAVRFVREIGAR